MGKRYSMISDRHHGLLLIDEESNQCEKTVCYFEKEKRNRFYFNAE